MYLPRAAVGDPLPTDGALHDALTALPNRTLLCHRLEQALCERADIAVLFLDVDRFKDINDTFGHQVGDELLRQLARRLQAASGPGDTLARFGGDEFALICRDVEGERGAVAAARRVLDVLRTPLTHDDRRLFLTASIGVVVPDGAEHTSESVLRDADVAMYRAKDSGGARYALFDREMRRKVIERVELEQDLRRAVENQEFVLAFQPLVSLRRRCIAGAEALVRWEHPRLGLVAPGAFVPIAEQSGLIVPIGEWVLTEACRRLAGWAADPTIDLPYVSVNLSGRQLADPELPEVVADVLRRTGAPADRLVLELTETVLIGETSSPTAVLQRLKALGVRLVLDDFGTGYSSLNYIKRFPINGLKVDRSFVAGIADGEEDRHILGAIVQMARGLGIEVVAEGVETLEQAGWVRALGCDVAQGYLFAAPAAAEAVEPLLRQGLALDRLAVAFEPEPSPAAPASAAVVPRRGPNEQTVPLGEAAEALTVSTSTLRRWADSGRIRAVRTSGGHRRFPVSEIQRLKASPALVAAPVVRATSLPAEPLPRLGALLGAEGSVMVGAAARGIYDRGRAGWLGTDDGEPHLRRWASGLASACAAGRYEDAIAITRTLMRQARYAGCSMLERQLFVERCGDIALRALQERAVERPELVGTRRLFARLRQALVEDAPAGV